MANHHDHGNIWKGSHNYYSDARFQENFKSKAQLKTKNLPSSILTTHDNQVSKSDTNVEIKWSFELTVFELTVPDLYPYYVYQIVTASGGK